jgi:hypothetical protein
VVINSSDEIALRFARSLGFNWNHHVAVVSPLTYHYYVLR